MVVGLHRAKLRNFFYSLRVAGIILYGEILGEAAPGDSRGGFTGGTGDFRRCSPEAGSRTFDGGAGVEGERRGGEERARGEGLGGGEGGGKRDRRGRRGRSEVHADAEEGVVVEGGVVGAEAAEAVGELLDGAAVGGAAVEEAELGGCAVYVDVEGDVELCGGEDVGPEAEVDDAVVAYEPAEGHVEAFEGGGLEVLGEAAGVGGALVGGGEFAVDGLGEGPGGGGREVDVLGAGEVGEGAVAEVYAA